MRLQIAVCLLAFVQAINAQTYISGVDPCSDQLYVYSNPPRVDTSHTYREAVRAYFERNIGSHYTPFDPSSSEEVDVSISDERIVVEVPYGVEKSATLVVNFYNLQRLVWCGSCTEAQLMPEVVSLAKHLDVPTESVVGVPNGASADLVLGQISINRGTKSDTVIGVRNEQIINPVLNLDSSHAPRAYIDRSSSVVSLYLFVPQSITPDPGEYSVVRIMASVSPTLGVEISSVPPFVYGAYGYGHGGCQELGFY